MIVMAIVDPYSVGAYATALDEFLAKNKGKGSKCQTCALFASNPEVAETLREARKRSEPVSFPLLAEFLQSHGHEMTDYQLRDHFRRHEND